MKQRVLVAWCFVAGIVGGMVGNGLMAQFARHSLPEYGVQRLVISDMKMPEEVRLVQSGKPPAAAAIGAVKSNNPVIDAVRKVGPAVVNIDTMVMRRQSVFGFDDPFGDFFGDDTFSRVVPSQGQGSGLIIDSANGYVLTNDHVVHDVVQAGKGQIKVSLPNKDTYEAKIVGSDPMYDIAVLKIDGKNLPSVKLGSSNDIIIGEWAVAMGNPFGYRNSVTLGVVSAVDRSLDTGNGARLEGLIQTDAAINPGNSGGPLCDIDGNVIGINTAIINGAEGLGFAIGASTVKPVIDELIKYGRVKHGWTGMQYWDISGRLANRLGLSSTDGALVAQIYNGSPADQAGIKPGDVILEANGKKIASVADLQTILRETRVGDQLTLKLSRKGKNATVKLKLVDTPSAQ